MLLAIYVIYKEQITINWLVMWEGGGDRNPRNNALGSRKHGVNRSTSLNRNAHGNKPNRANNMHKKGFNGDSIFNYNPYKYHYEIVVIFNRQTGQTRAYVRHYRMNVDKTITVKDPEIKYKNDPMFGKLAQMRAQVYRTYGTHNPYHDAFSNGGRDAAFIVSAPLAAIFGAQVAPLVATAAGAAPAAIVDAEVLSAFTSREVTAQLFKSMAWKGTINLIGQYEGMILSNDTKFDMIGLAADMLTTNGASSVIGGVGEGGIQYFSEGKKDKNGKLMRDANDNIIHWDFYSGANSPGLGAAKFTTGFLFGKYGDEAKTYIGANGFSEITIKTFEVVTKTVDEGLQQMQSKLDESISKRQDGTRK